MCNKLFASFMEVIESLRQIALLRFYIQKPEPHLHTKPFYTLSTKERKNKWSHYESQFSFNYFARITSTRLQSSFSFFFLFFFNNNYSWKWREKIRYSNILKDAKITRLWLKAQLTWIYMLQVRKFSDEKTPKL